MKGMVNKGIQEMVEEKFGAESWKRIKRLARCDAPFFAIGEDYPDEMTTALVEAASNVSGLSDEQFLIEFGKHWILNTGKSTYPTFYSLAGYSPREFLYSLNQIYKYIARNSTAPPLAELSYEDLPDGRLVIHYKSKHDLCASFLGNIIGVGLLFNQVLRVKETACKKRGDSHCTMEVTFP
jgi:hypothetical protein